MAQFLIFQLYGPLAAWGEIAVGEVRASADHPTHSALVGLVGAALGVTRVQEADQRRLADSYEFGLRLDAPGDMLRDYHTIEVPTGKGARQLITRADELAYDKKATMLTSRDYRADALYTVAMWPAVADPPWALGAIAAALKTPAYALFLGRKSCPLALPLAPQLIEAATLAEALAGRPLPAMLRGLPDLQTPRGQQPRPVRVYWPQATRAIDPGLAPTMIHERWDHPTSRQRWQFAPRQEALATVEAAGFEEEK